MPVPGQKIHEGQGICQQASLLANSQGRRCMKAATCFRAASRSTLPGAKLRALREFTRATTVPIGRHRSAARARSDARMKFASCPAVMLGRESKKSARVGTPVAIRVVCGRGIVTERTSLPHAASVVSMPEPTILDMNEFAGEAGGVALQSSHAAAGHPFTQAASIAT